MSAAHKAELYKVYKPVLYKERYFPRLLNIINYQPLDVSASFVLYHRQKSTQVLMSSHNPSTDLSHWQDAPISTDGVKNRKTIWKVHLKLAYN